MDAMRKQVAVLIAGLAFVTAGVAGAASPPTYWMTAKEANALLYEAPVYLPGYGQFYFRSGRCIAYGPYKKDARKRTLWRYFRCYGSAESTAQPGQRWALIIHVAPTSRGFRLLRVAQVDCTETSSPSNCPDGS